MVEKDFTIVNFYHFFDVKDKDFLLYKFLYFCKKKKIKGSVIISDEGINASLGFKSSLLEDFETFLRSCKLPLGNMIFHKALSDEVAFERLKIKIKSEIVSLKQNCSGGCSINYITPDKWDDFTKESEVAILDTRNNYESDLGCFDGSIKPNIKSFRELPKWFKENELLFKDKKIATYCTGGIRCEKFLLYLRNKGFNNIFQLKGGILGYLRYFSEDSHCSWSGSSWSGKCFVFDNRTFLN